MEQNFEEIRYAPEYSEGDGSVWLTVFRCIRIIASYRRLYGGHLIEWQLFINVHQPGLFFRSDIISLFWYQTGWRYHSLSHLIAVRYFAHLGRQAGKGSPGRDRPQHKSSTTG